MTTAASVRLVDQIIDRVVQVLARSNLVSRAVPVTVISVDAAAVTVDGQPALTVDWRGGLVPASYLEGLVLTPGQQYVAVKTGLQLLVVGRAVGVPVDGGDIED